MLNLILWIYFQWIKQKHPTIIGVKLNTTLFTILSSMHNEANWIPHPIGWCCGVICYKINLQYPIGWCYSMNMWVCVQIIIHLITIPSLFIAGVIFICTGFVYKLFGVANWIRYFYNVTRNISRNIINDRFSIFLFLEDV